MTPQTNNRYLTKSRFKLALDCPTKLFYTRKPEYENQQDADPFLEALAQGGFQVEELARMNYPEGIAILGEDYNYRDLAARTQELLQRENVVIFEAAFLHDGLFIRTDILIKKQKQIQLIEVKAKSISCRGHNGFQTTGSWSAFLYDVAFQQYVIQQAHPEFSISAYLNLVNKDAVATVDGLNQKFKLVSNSGLRTGVSLAPGLTKADLGESILAKINVVDEISTILTSNPLFEGQSFAETVHHFKIHYESDLKIYTPIGKHCKGCEFYIENPNPDQKSGFHKCWQHQLGLSQAEVNEPKTYDVWDFRASAKLIESGKYFMHQLNDTDLKIKPEAAKISRTERQSLQIEKTLNNDHKPHFELEGLRDAFAHFTWPLNCIDFETTAVAIPFLAGMRPYEQLAFQFSHHIIHEDGSVEHHNEYLNTQIGAFPNFDFIRALKKSLQYNTGSIFRYHNHENTILNVIYSQLKVSGEPDREELMQFIQHISHNTGSNADTWSGERDMIDLYKMVVSYYYELSMGGSNSIKAVLPSVLNSSIYLQEKYSKQLKEIGVSSLNFPDAHRFIQLDEGGKVISPYKNLPPLFDNWDAESLDRAVTNIEGISDGGAALTAYGKLQFEDVPKRERLEIENGLLRYCELDTLAMAMILEYFREVIDEN
ncbi:DUF2779 domain-containing protein [Leeuwenhoekiella aequorea]|uniref:DUF2779 domain-containing protein n=1 Tax=Leeuwenhoekiella aequorea TaxID=283736 RepID=UPI00352D841A|tara:strand:- start:44468 stop:46432 length:1965 start_codon:yes stop_codon:yes gene_type:complete